MRKNKAGPYILLLYLSICLLLRSANFNSYAMNAPGNGGENWHYRDTNHRWYYYPPGENPHTGWLAYEGEWYWFDSNGCMTSEEQCTIDGVRYQFYGNGHMVWNQYIGLKYYDEDGMNDENKNIRLIGKETPTSQDRDTITDNMYEVPRSWIRKFVEDGWELMFYKKKAFFQAPYTDLGVYYVHHSVDINYKKAKFTEADAVTEAFGGYVGYASGCYEDGSQWMERLWSEFPNLRNILEIPDYYSEDEKFYFSKIFAAYMDTLKRETIERNAPGAAKVMNEILLSLEDEETKARFLAEEEKRQREDAVRRERQLQEEGGPGVVHLKPEE